LDNVLVRIWLQGSHIARAALARTRAGPSELPARPVASQAWHRPHRPGTPHWRARWGPDPCQRRTALL